MSASGGIFDLARAEEQQTVFWLHFHITNTKSRTLEGTEKQTALCLELHALLAGALMTSPTALLPLRKVSRKQDSI